VISDFDLFNNLATTLAMSQAVTVTCFTFGFSFAFVEQFFISSARGKIFETMQLVFVPSKEGEITK